MKWNDLLIILLPLQDARFIEGISAIKNEKLKMVSAKTLWLTTSVRWFVKMQAWCETK